MGAIYTWVLGQYSANSEQGKQVLLHSQSYYLINKDRSKSDPVIVGFKYVGYPVPAHLTEVLDPERIEKLERWSKPWENNKSKMAQQPVRENFAAMFPSVK